MLAVPTPRRQRPALESTGRSPWSAAGSTQALPQRRALREGRGKARRRAAQDRRSRGAGCTSAGWTLGNLGGSNASSYDAWLARYDGAGNQLWIHQLGTNGDESALAAVPNGAGGFYVGGYTEGSLAAPNAGKADLWLARYEACSPSSGYCTAKTNSAGCVPSIAASGTPSASAGSGFAISTSNVLDNVFGLYLYSKTGPHSAPFQGGILCAQPPLLRTPLQNSGGTAPCGGMFQDDFNAYVASGKDPGLVAGQQVWVQTWSRDPGFAPPNNTSLSDAVSFTLCP